MSESDSGMEGNGLCLEVFGNGNKFHLSLWFKRFLPGDRKMMYRALEVHVGSQIGG